MNFDFPFRFILIKVVNWILCDHSVYIAILLCYFFHCWKIIYSFFSPSVSCSEPRINFQVCSQHMKSIITEVFSRRKFHTNSNAHDMINAYYTNVTTSGHTHTQEHNDDLYFKRNFYLVDANMLRTFQESLTLINL